MGIAIRSKQGPGQIFLVTDAMSTIATDMTRLNGREILRDGGRLTVYDGTLAGADMLSSVRFVHERRGLPLEEAFRMAQPIPPTPWRIAKQKGRSVAGADADFVLLTPELELEVKLDSWTEGFRSQRSNVILSRVFGVSPLVKAMFSVRKPAEH
ncbi:hypothetical protein LPU83_pLPU83b_0368 (plasmid) [Rhizobium favelukesii]|uniref:Amidohydrolase-related domain-containing protein n=1 Tax=Rhizobium favelukesii TaxID=348824 RepID=W6RJ75_9HYPH|nr:hypothetical protein LPU83_pLPU83b_0368 [Rhizobium favelukesii]